MSITDEELRSNIQTLLSAAAGKARVLAATKTVDVQTINKSPFRK